MASSGGGARDATYGLVAEFGSPSDLIAAARRTREAGYRHFDAYTPYPVEGLAEAMEFEERRLPLLVFLGGLAGCAGGYLLQVYVSVFAYPLNVGGRPLHSWPSFIPVTFETTVLAAAITAVLGMLALNGLPRPHHPLFNLPRFALASRDRFFLCIEAADPLFDRVETRRFLEGLGPRVVSDVED